MTSVLQLRMLALVARVLMSTHVPPRPAVEAALLDVGDVVGHEVVAESVALVGGAPQLAGDGVDGFADAVAQAPGVDLDELAVGRELEHVGAMKFFRMGVGVVDVGVRADGGEELAAVLREDQVAGPVAAAAQASAAGQVGELFHGAARLQVAVLVGEAHDAVGVADVNPLRIGSEGIKRDAEGLMQAGGEDGDLLRLAVRADAAKDLDLAGFALGQKQVAVGRDANEARIVEAGGVEVHLEALGRNGPRVGGTGNDVGAVVDGLIGRGRGQVGDGDVAADAGRLVRRVGKGGLAGEDGILGVDGGR